MKTFISPIIELPDIINAKERYMVLRLRADCDHSVALNYKFYEEGSEDADFFIRFGILPRVSTTVVIDRNWINAKDLYPGSLPGELKVVCHGHRIKWEKTVRAELSVLPCFEEVDVKVEEAYFTDTYPEKIQLEDVKLVDKYGQNKCKKWQGKIQSDDELKEKLNEFLDVDVSDGARSLYGGFINRKIADGTGFFTKYKKNGRWFLADPDGYAFFSMGPDCVNIVSDGRIDGIEKWLDYLPDENSKPYSDMYRKTTHGRDGVLFSYLQSNYYRAFGDDYREKWEKCITTQLKKMGLNTVANWSDSELIQKKYMPYVYMLPEFPTTSVTIFRDFPDVFSDEYKKDAERCARALAGIKDDPYMIGYFLRNEPSWAFVDNIIMAEEVLGNSEFTVTKAKLIEHLRSEYKDDINSFNSAWNTEFASFDDLKEPVEDAASFSEKAKKDLRTFSVMMVRAYVEIPSKAVKAVDPNHMNLGMRWAWISDPDLVAGWENFDVFSINCYAVDPTKAIEHVVELGVDLPIVIGEFHFGALDAGPTATGLEGVLTQEDRGKAYSYYLERVAAHPNGTGAHYFQCYDQFVLGRFDGENYNIGIFDICGQPYAEMSKHIRETSDNIEHILFDGKAPTTQEPERIPMIAY